MGARQKATKRNYPGNTGKGEVSPLWWLGAIGLALFFVIFPYDRGLFNGYESSFEPPIYKSAIYIFILSFLPLIYLIRNWKISSHTGILSIAVMLIPLIYWISSMQAVSDYYADFMVMIYGMFALLFISGLYTAGAARTRHIIEGGIMIAGGIIVLFGLFNLFGQIYYMDALWLAHDGYRLTSVFQYSNTYAGFLIALFLACLYYASHNGNSYIRLMNAAFLVPIWISFMLTFSRGAFVIIPVVVLLIIPLMKLTKQIAYLLYMVVSIAISMVILGKVTAVMNDIAAIVQPTGTKALSTISLFNSLPATGWGLLLAASLVTAAFVWLYHAKLETWVEGKFSRIADRKWSFLLIPALIAVVTTVCAAVLLSSPAVRGMLPQQLADRFENINFNQHSVLERITFYKDGVRAASDYPVIGAGGGAWQAMYEQYQNNPYESRQAHSFYVQVLVEVGWLGLAILIGFIAYAYFLFVRSHIRHPELRGSHLVFFILSLSLLAHSAMDFDMSYVYIGALAFLSLGCMLAPYHDKLEVASLAKLQLNGWQKAVYPGLLAVICLVLLVVTSTQYSAVSRYNETVSLAVKQKASYNQLMERLEKSIDQAPDQSTYSITKVSWILQVYEQNRDPELLKQAQETLDAARKHDEYNRGLLALQIRVHQLNGKLEDTLPVLDEALLKFPWMIEMYEHAMLAYRDVRTIALQNKDEEKATQYEHRIRDLEAEVNRRIAMLETLPEEQKQGRSFNFTAPMKEVLASLK
ncbi:O-antigen ligase family protein [Paenibacillus sp. J5C_2022]|uniref:O-antigen ligase family protein n=1 Tax=Paenibacillus sp. J5C2022 TaxID=2977129 RepID=UPI0021D27D5C|nr:O-antigen ligase family protein [Paenibacillus sp. J5C2022]MCU6709193.1 O-antigen ligase family protein [Paenibacillus sp. J5C2022]